jgi:hypothetical protein
MIELEVYKKSDFYEDYISSQKEYYERSNADAYFAERLAKKDKEIAELKAALEDVKATAYAESVDAGMENRRLKRALYKACTNWARSERYTEATWHGDEHREELWAEVEDKCLKKLEEYR